MSNDRSGPPPNGVFSTVRPELDFPRDEATILAFWKERDIFKRTLQAETRQTGPSRGTKVFYEGPPTANGMPHNGHVLTRAVKDIFPRFWTMQGYDVPRKAGWDTHGLPVEVEVEKELSIHGKADIEAYGIEPFIRRCLESVFRYTDVWERITDKIAFWVDTETAYVTYHRPYVESVWWALAELHKKGLLYRGHRVSWWWPQGGTALSAAEVGWNYKTVDDPSCFVVFPLEDEPRTGLCTWTTTPWTLPSNGYAAVRPDVDYAVVQLGADNSPVDNIVVAAALVPELEKKLGRALPLVDTKKGADLVGKRYRPPFDTYAKDLFVRTATTKEGRTVPWFWRVIAADFVTLDTGTGIVHIAPAFGEDDNTAHKRELATYTDASEVPLICAVRPDGTMTDGTGEIAGLWVKDVDPRILKDLSARGLLVHQEKYRHDYPFCWRADDDPLIQLARPAWYIRTTERIQDAIANNRAVHWMPPHIQEGRFGDFLANNVDWALSRERFWGTPLNIWVAEDDETVQLAPSSVAEIESYNPNAFDHFKAAKAADPTLSDHLMVHKPWIDQVTFKHPETGQTMRRVPEVIDAWFDSGSMPFAQFGFPHQPGSREAFDRAFPADFISEAIDQTRGWFYSLLMISTLVFDAPTQARLGLGSIRDYPYPYKSCVVLGHVGDREGKKESKGKGNYTPPEIILERVRMEFAVLPSAELKSPVLTPGTVCIAREDYEGLDLTGEGGDVVAYRADRQGEPKRVRLVPTKALPRRVVAVHPDDAAALGVIPEASALKVKPNDVPRLALEHKLTIEDPTAPAPGADAFRWFFYANSPPWTNTRHSLTNVRATQKEFAIKLRNVYAFFVIYANIDGFDPARNNPVGDGVADALRDALAKAEGYRTGAARSMLDRWILSELHLAIRQTTEHLSAYRLYEAAQTLVELVDAVSNWYVRRSRPRFWSPTGQDDQAKADAYFTLYEVLVTIARLSAPFVPFFAEELYQNLVRGPWKSGAAESVHLNAYPLADEASIDEPLARQMRAVRELVSVGLSVRTTNKLRVRQPLARADVVVSDPALADALRAHTGLIAEELNVHEVSFLRPGEEGERVRYALKPNFRALGPKLGKKVQLAKAVLGKADAGALRAELADKGQVVIDLEGEAVTLTPEEIEVAVQANPGFAAAGARVGVVVLHTELTDDLKDEGLSREILARLQGIRKDMELGFTERIAVGISGSERAERVARRDAAVYEREALATVEVGGASTAALEQGSAERREASIDGEALVLVVRRP